jgi:hypothetical protein
MLLVSLTRMMVNDEEEKRHSGGRRRSTTNNNNVSPSNTMVVADDGFVPEKIAATRLRQSIEQPSLLGRGGADDTDTKPPPPAQSSISSEKKRKTPSVCSSSNTKATIKDMKLPFALKLHYILKDAEIQGFDSILSWTQEGKAFQIHKPETFMKSICPRYFHQTKFNSFIRVRK